MALVVVGLAAGCSGAAPASAGGRDAAPDQTASGPGDDGGQEQAPPVDAPADDGPVATPDTDAGTSPDLDDLDGTPSTDGPALPSVRVTRGDPTQTRWHTLTIEGHGLPALDGRLVRVRIGMPDRPPERLGEGAARVESGAFSLTFPDVWEYSLYKQKLVLFDTNEDGRCATDEPVYVDFRAANIDTTLTLMGSVPPNPDHLEIPPSRDPGDACRMWNTPWPEP